MRLDDFDFELPPERIAQEPASRRDGSRLLVHRRDLDTLVHTHVAALPQFLRAGDLLVLNDTRVLPARILGRRASGAKVEFLFCEPTADPSIWKALCHPAKKLSVGERCELVGGALEVTMVARCRDEDGRPAPEWHVRLEEPERPGESTAELLERYGRVPLPPYIDRELTPADRERYQTVYARERGAVAAPTAGLHFTEELLQRLEDLGVGRAFVTLHVGPGTFRPIQVETVEDHRMHSERYELPQATVDAIAHTKERGGRVVCVGTTSLRVLEGAAAEGPLEPRRGRTSLYVYPGFEFGVCDALLTNFHLPRSSLLVLVSALVGRERTLELYREAIEEEYRFFSYGDAMLIL